MLRETKENVQGINSDEKETGIQINGVDQKEETNIQPEKNEETRIRKKEERPRNLQDILKGSNIRIIRGARRRGRTKNWKLIWTNNEGELPQSGKGIDFQEVQEAQRVPKKLDPRKQTPRHIIITLPEVKNKEGILKAAREKETLTYRGVPIRLLADFSKETL